MHNSHLPDMRQVHSFPILDVWVVFLQDAWDYRVAGHQKIDEADQEL